MSSCANTALVFLYEKVNRYSVHALAGALETRRRFDDLPVDFSADATEVLRALGHWRAEKRRVILALSFTTAMRNRIAELVRDARSAAGQAGRGGEDGKLLVVGGGAHPTADPLGTLRMGCDVVVRGEGEATFLELVERVVDGGDWREARGIAYLDEAGQLRETAPIGPVDLDDYPPFPTRRGKFGHIELTRGCPFACGFCQIPRLHGTHPRHRSVESVARYMGEMRLGGRTDYRFISPNAFGYGSPDGRDLNVDALRELLRAMREMAGPEGRIYFGSFPSEVRPEFVNGETVGLVRRYANNDNLVVGAQSGGDRMLEHCRRGHTVEDVRRAVSCIRRAGFQANVDFIFGLPGETEPDRDASISFMRELATMGARIHAHTFLPIPQTRFADAPPGKVDARVRAALLGTLVPSGAAYGNWREQEELARLFSGRDAGMERGG